MNDRKTSSFLVAGAVAAAFALSAGSAFASEHEDGAEDAGVKCYGIAMAGENDCASAGGNSCAGHSTVDNDPMAWKHSESAEACEEAGGSLEAGGGEEAAEEEASEEEASEEA